MNATARIGADQSGVAAGFRHHAPDFRCTGIAGWGCLKPDEAAGPVIGRTAVKPFHQCRYQFRTFAWRGGNTPDGIIRALQEAECMHAPPKSPGRRIVKLDNFPECGQSVCKTSHTVVEGRREILQSQRRHRYRTAHDI